VSGGAGAGAGAAPLVRLARRAAALYQHGRRVWCCLLCCALLVVLFSAAGVAWAAAHVLSRLAGAVSLVAAPGDAL